MNSLQRKRYRKGTLVYVPDLNVLKDSFSSWNKSQVFRVVEDSAFEGEKGPKRYVWVDSNSKALFAKDIQLTTPSQRKEYRKELRLESVARWKELRKEYPTPKRLEKAIRNVKANRDSSKTRKGYEAENRLLNGLKTLL